MVRRMDFCAGISATQQASQSTQSSWLNNNPYWKGNNGSKLSYHSFILLFAMSVLAKIL